MAVRIQVVNELTDRDEVCLRYFTTDFGTDWNSHRTYETQPVKISRCSRAPGPRVLLLMGQVCYLFKFAKHSTPEVVQIRVTGDSSCPNVYLGEKESYNCTSVNRYEYTNSWGSMNKTLPQFLEDESTCTLL
jgi:hypothetical protein